MTILDIAQVFKCFDQHDQRPAATCDLTFDMDDTLVHREKLPLQGQRLACTLISAKWCARRKHINLKHRIVAHHFEDSAAGNVLEQGTETVCYRLCHQPQILVCYVPMMVDYMEQSHELHVSILSTVNIVASSCTPINATARGAKCS